MEDLLHDLQHYNKSLTISQVAKYFEKKGIKLTKSMIQNYVRDGLLPPPVQKRHYTHKHLAALVLIDYLKSVFDMADIKAALTPLMDEEGLPLETYAMLLQQMGALSESWRERMAPLFFNKNNEGTLSLLMLMTHGAELKALANEMIERRGLRDEPING